MAKHRGQISSLVLNANTPKLIVTNGLVGYWHFQKGVSGSSWNNIAPATVGQYNGTINGPVLQADGMYFDGVDDFVAIAHNLNLDVYSIEVCINNQHTATSGFKYVVSGSTSDGYLIDHSTNKFTHYYPSNAYSATTAIAKNTDAYVTFTKDALNNGYWYINNAKQSQIQPGKIGDTSASTLYFGKHYSTTGLEFKGLIKYVRIYSRQLTDAEVAQNYAAGTDVGLVYSYATSLSDTITVSDSTSQMTGKNYPKSLSDSVMLTESTAKTYNSAPSLKGRAGMTALVTTYADDSNVSTGITRPFFGTNQTVWVGSNSYITFGNGSSQYSGISHSSTAGLYMVAADRNWQWVGVLDTTDYTRIRWEGQSGSGNGNPPYVWEATIFSDGVIQVITGPDLPTGAVGLSFIANGSDTNALDYNYAVTDCIRFTPKTPASTGYTVAYGQPEYTISHPYTTSLSDSVSTSDSVTKQFNQTKLLADTVSLSDAITPTFTAGTTSSVVTNGLIGYWNFQQGLSGSNWNNIAPGKDGLYGATLTGGSVSQANGVYFDGIDDLVTVNTPPNLVNSSYTFEVIFKMSAVTSSPSFMDWEGSSLFYMDYQNSSKQLRLYAGGGIRTFTLASNLLANQEYIYTATYDYPSKTLKMYLNGALQNTFTTINPITSANTQMYFGAYKSGSTTYADFKGWISSFKIYNAALSATDVTQNYNNGSAVGLGGNGTANTKSLSDTVTSSDSISNQSARKLSLNDSVSTTDSITTQALWNKSLSDTISTSETTSSTFTASYLQMDGVDDKITTPALTFNQVVLDVTPEIATDSFQKYLSFNFEYFQRHGDLHYDNWSSAVLSVLKNGISQTNATAFVTQNARATYTINTQLQTNRVAYIFNQMGTNGYVKGKIYSVKFYNGATLVAHYDMSTSTVRDQSGNGNHASLVGGVWVGGGKAYSTIVTDTVSTTDSIAKQASWSNSLSDSISTTDSISQKMTRTVSLNDSVSTTDYATFGTKYLQMDGVDDNLLTPSMTFDKIVFDGLIDTSINSTSLRYFFQNFSGTALYMRWDTSATLQTGGITQTGFVNNTRSIITINTSTVPSTSALRFFARQDGLLSLTAGRIYNIKFYNGATLVAHYDMTTGTVKDQSGNGNHATLTGGSWIDTNPTASYLQMDGVDDYLQLPTMTIKKIVIDGVFNTQADFKMLIDARSGMNLGYVYARSDGSITSAGANFNVTGYVRDTRTTVTFLAQNNMDVNGNFTDNVNIFSNNTGTENLRGLIYNIYCYNAANTLVAYYDMTKGNVQDQSGNGNHATLSGGTFIDPSTPATYAKSLSDTVSSSEIVGKLITSQKSLADSVTSTDSMNSGLNMIVSDSFNRTASTTSLGSTDSAYGGSSKVWTITPSSGNAVYGINSSGRAYVATTSTNRTNALVDTGYADGIIECKFYGLDAASQRPKISIRAIDSNNVVHLGVDFGSGKNWLQLYYYDVGVNTLVWDTIAAGKSIVDGDIVKVMFIGSTYTIYINNVQVGTATLAYNSTITTHGFNMYNYSTSQIDDWKFYTSSLGAGYTKTLSDSTTISDSISKQTSLAKSLSDSLVISDSIPNKQPGFAKSLADTIAVSDAITNKVLALNKSLSDSVNTTETSTKQYNGSAPPKYHLSLDGVDDFLSTNVTLPTDFEVEMDFVTYNDPNIQKEYTLFGQYVGGNSGRFLAMIGTTSSPTGNGKVCVFISGQTLICNTKLTVGQRYKLKFVMTNKQLSVYLDGVLDGQFTYSNFILQTTTMSIGVYNKADLRGFSKMDLYGFTVKNILAYDMTTGTVQDQSGNGNHATLNNGGTWVVDGTGFAASLTDTINTADSTTKQISSFKSLSDSVSTTDSAITTTVTFNKSLNDSTLISDSSITKQVGFKKSIADFVTTTDSANRAGTSTKSLSDSTSISDSPSSRIISDKKSVNDSVTTTDSITRSAAFQKLIVDSVSLSEMFTDHEDIIRPFSDTLTLSDSISASFNQASTSYNKSLNDAVALSDSQTKQMSGVKSLGDTVSISDSQTKRQVAKALTDSISASENANKQVSDQKSLADTVSINESLTKQFIGVKVISDSISSTDSVSKQSTKSLADSVASSDSSSRNPAYTKSLADTVSTTDIASKSVARTKSISDTVTTTDSPVSKKPVYTKTVLDTVSLLDSTTKRIVGSVVLTDTVTPTESFGASSTIGSLFTRTVLDAVSVADSFDKRFAGVKILTDTTITSDSPANKIRSSQKSLTDSVAASDTTAKRMAALKSFADSVDATEMFTNKKSSFYKLVADAVSPSDSTSKQVATFKSITDTVTTSESVSKNSVYNGIDHVVDLADNVLLSDAASEKYTGLITKTDTVSLTEASSKVIERNKSLSDSVATFDATSRSLSTTRTLSDSVSTQDTVTSRSLVQQHHNITLTDQLVVDDVMVAKFRSRPEDPIKQLAKVKPKGGRLRSDGNLTYHDFVLLLDTLLSAAWGKEWGTFLHVRPRGNLPTNQSLPLITYYLENMVPGKIGKDTKEIRPRYRTSEVDSVNGTVQRTNIYGQAFDASIVFEVWAPTNLEAEELQHEFRRFLQTYAGYFKEKGLRNFQFVNLGIPQFPDRSINDQYETRILRYMVSFEELHSVPTDYLKVISVVEERMKSDTTND